MDINPDQLLRSLSDPVRRQLARLLSESPLTVGELTDVLSLPQSTVSRHLKALRTTGLLVDRRDGTRVFAALAEPRTNGDSELIDILNRWVREQTLAANVKERLDQVLRQRDGVEDVSSRLAHQWDDLRCQYFGSRFHLEALGGLLPAEWHVLDIGTGTGYLLPVLGRLFERIYAVDPSPAMLDLARQRASQEGLDNIEFHSGCLQELPLDNDSVDAAIAILVLHHADQLEPAFAELRRVLKPGGRLLAVDFAPHEQDEFQREMGDPTRGHETEVVLSGLKQAGFESVAIRPLAVSHYAEDGPLRPAPELFLFTASNTSA